MPQNPNEQTNLHRQEENMDCGWLGERNIGQRYDAACFIWCHADEKYDNDIEAYTKSMRV